MSKPVRHRKVWYFHGFDPASTARYRRIFAEASARLSVEVSDLVDVPDGWLARRDDVTTDFHYLRYEDLVRDAQQGGIFVRLGRGLRAVAGMLVDGAALKLGWRTWALALSPQLTFFAPLVIALPQADQNKLFATVFLGVLLLGAMYLLFGLKMILAADLFAYMRALANGTGPQSDALEERLPDLAAQISPDGDEALVVGHSLGGVWAIRSVAARLPDWPEGCGINLLTLGSVHGILLAQKGAGRDRLAAAIATIASDPRVTWVDVSSPRDAFCVPLTDPLSLIGDLAQPGMTSPRVLSAQLRRAPGIPGDRRTLFPAMRLHMAYLLAPQGEGSFDYADWTTANTPFRDRVAGRGNSPKARMWHG